MVRSSPWDLGGLLGRACLPQVALVQGRGSALHRGRMVRARIHSIKPQGPKSEGSCLSKSLVGPRLFLGKSPGTSMYFLYESHFQHQLAQTKCRCHDLPLPIALSTAHTARVTRASKGVPCSHFHTRRSLTSKFAMVSPMNDHAGRG